MGKWDLVTIAAKTPGKYGGRKKKSQERRLLRLQGGEKQLKIKELLNLIEGHIPMMPGGNNDDGEGGARRGVRI